MSKIGRVLREKRYVWSTNKAYRMKRYTYKITDGEQELLCEEDIGEQGHIVFCRDYGTDPATDRTSIYDEQGNLVEEVETSDGEEMSRIQYGYNEKGVVTEKCLFIGGEVYERRTTEYTEDGYIRTTFQEGEEVEKLVCKIKDFDSSSAFYQNSKLVETHLSRLDQEAGTLTTEIRDEKDELIKKEIEYFDKDNPLKKEIYNGKEELSEIYVWEYENSLPVKETFSYPHVGRSSTEHVITWEYDSKANCVRKEIRELSGRLLEFHLWNYDELGRVIEESGVSHGRMQPIYAAAPTGGFHYAYTYGKYGQAIPDKTDD
ncbi:MAG: hypothetical protein K0S33_1918 [Bacteroidetes bacterium]|nr:hypothetical protein [Bacteroidota bacterium]